MNDDRISQHLQQQAEGITLSPPDPAGAMRRGSCRRTRRRAAILGSVAVVGVLATSVAVRDDSPDQKLDLANGAAAAASTYDWSVVSPTTGLAYGSSSVQLADGSIYSLSTEPGPYREDSYPSRTLYRSDDGAEWSGATLPSGVSTSNLSGGGDTLYSVGTSPAGGIVVSTSTDRAGSWAKSTLGDDVAQLKEQYGNKIVLGAPAIAAKDATHAVVSIGASTSTDLSLYKPEYANGDYGYEWTDDGVRIYENPKAECEGSGKIVDAPASTLATTAAGEDPAAPTTIVVNGRSLDANEAAGIRSCMQEANRPGAQPTVASFTYDELGIVGALRDHVGGKAYTYVTDDGTAFESVDLPADIELGSLWGWLADPVATADGYRLLFTGGDENGSTTTVLRSADGHAWEVATTIPGSVGEVGTLDGRAAFTMWGNDGSQPLVIEQADGQFRNVDLRDAVSLPTGSSANVDTVAFGPLGLAAVVGVADKEGGSYTQYLVHSTDGSTLQVKPVADVIASRGQIVGLVVTADAIAARLVEAGSATRTKAGVSRVLVGTPTA